MDPLIQWRSTLLQQLAVHPYDIQLWLDLSDLDAKLGFTDIGTASAYRALLMAEAALDPNKVTFPATLSNLVRTQMKLKLGTVSPFIIAEELNALLLAAYRAVLYCLAGTGAYWDCPVDTSRVQGASRTRRPAEISQSQTRPAWTLNRGF